MKHTSTVLKPSIPFHTLVKFVDAEDIANDKIRTHDLALEVNNITKQLQTQTLDSSNPQQLMFTQPRDPNNKNKPAYKKYCCYCHRANHSLSACFKKQRDKDEKKKLILDQNLLKNFLYNTFVLLLLIEQKNMIHDIEAEVHNEIIIITKTITLTQDIVLHLEIDSVVTKTPLLHKTHDHDMTIINEIHDLTDHPPGHHTDPLIDATLALDTDHVHIHATITSNDILLHSDHLHDHDTLDLLDHGPVHIRETNLTQFNLKHRMIQLTSKACITLLKWLMRSHLQVGFTLYTHIHHQTKSNKTIPLD